MERKVNIEAKECYFENCNQQTIKIRLVNKNFSMYRKISNI